MCAVVLNDTIMFRFEFDFFTEALINANTVAHFNFSVNGHIILFGLFNNENAFHVYNVHSFSLLVLFFP